MTQSAPDAPDKTAWKVKWHVFWPKARIMSGLILFVYVLIHFSNHAVGLISNEALDAVGTAVKSFWRFPPMSIALYGALAVHFMGALVVVYQRRTLQMPMREWLQLLLGLAIPFLMLTHVMGTRYAEARYGIDDHYAYVLLSTFVFSPSNIYWNAAGLIAAWVHGCIGMHMWLRFKGWYSHRVFQTGLALAVLIPTLSLTGYLSAGRRTAPLASDGDYLEIYYERLNLADDRIWTWLATDIDRVFWILLAVTMGAVAARLLPPILRKRRREISISYLDGPVINQRAGPTLLELSQLSGVPHASVCGGRGRCSTCRVRILNSKTPLEPPSDEEQKVLQRVHAPEDVRLACQIHPAGDMHVIRILPSEAGNASRSHDEPWSTGTERAVTVMFADLRDFTRTAENRLPFDVVYLINQFSRTMGQAVEGHGGRIDKFLGDGFMALFGVETTEKVAAQQALNAVDAMIAELRILNERLAGDLDEPLRMGIGLHSGTVILGDMGYGSARGLTAIGDVVNVASRLESATKTLGCSLCVSEDVVKAAQMKTAKGIAQDIEVRGKQTKLSIYGINDIADLNVETTT